MTELENSARARVAVDPDVTTAAVRRDGEGWVVQIVTPGDERELKVYINSGVAFDDYPDFALDPGWRLCPQCGVNPRHKHAIYYCAWCGHKLPDYPQENQTP